MLTEVLSSAFPRRDAVPTVNGKRSGSDRDATRRRLAIIVSHPIQYYVPLYQRLAQRPDLDVKVFFTWHAATAAVHDHGFRTPVAWDIPLTEGYAFELVPNQASDPGTHHFFGLRNPTLVARVTAWQPDVIHLTGWAWLSHLLALRAFRGAGIPVLFRGDSHLLGAARHGPRWWLKRQVLRRVFSWPAGFLVVGAANRAYYEAFGVDSDRLFACPHSIDVARFAEPAQEHEAEAARWRSQLGIAPDQCVLLFAGKFERKKQPLELMRAAQKLSHPGVVLVLVGGGELEDEVRALAAADRKCFRVLPFQNQSRMPTVYRMGDLFVLPSAYGETWGLAVIEALACGRPALVSDRVGCAGDVVDASCGRIFAVTEPGGLVRALNDMVSDRNGLRQMRRAALMRAWSFDIAQTEAAVVGALARLGAS
ncbi:MAG: glycosyltransferase family 4 protein [Xanthobacteraceae bacterium]|jgi:glycosyltransferase involved in cell wall biosynthesis